MTTTPGQEYLGALVVAAEQLAPYVEPAIDGYLASEPDPADARAVFVTLTEIRDLVQAQLDKVSKYVLPSTVT